MALIDQALLGYSHGHRLLAASTEIPAVALNLLLGVSDAEVASGRVVSGLPLPETGLYAFCATWPAPEITRPGAVWSHALLVPRSVLAMIDARALAELLHRPRDLSEVTSGLYERPVPAPTSAAKLRSDIETLRLCGRAVYASHNHVALVSSLDSGESAALTLWAAQWPSLRERFSFRVRGRQPRAVESVDLVVAVGEEERQRKRDRDAEWLDIWLGELTADPRLPPTRSERTLGSWLDEFGPYEPPRPASARALGRLWMEVTAANASAVAQRLEERYSAPEDGEALKNALFGRSVQWWEIHECARLRLLLGSSSSGWDAVALCVGTRVEHETLAGRWQGLIAALRPATPEGMRAALLDGLLGDPQPAMVAALAAQDTRLAVGALERSSLGELPDTWRELSGHDADVLLGESKSNERAADVAAALIAGHVGPVLKSSSRQIIQRALGRVDADTLGRLAHDDHAEELVRIARPPIALRLMAAGVRTPAKQRRQLLEQLRGQADEQWLRVAVAALVDDPKALPVVFGPVHRAITEDRLPRDLWQTLGPAVPEAADPAQRLRKLLVRRAKAEGWDAERLSEALRDAGPYAGEILRDLDDEEPIFKLFKAVLRLWGFR